MTGFLLAQIADGLPYSWVPLEPWCALLQAMLYSGCLCEPGVACLLHGAQMVDVAGTLSSADHSAGQMAQDRAGTQMARRAAQALGAGRSLTG